MRSFRQHLNEARGSRIKYRARPTIKMDDHTWHSPHPNEEHDEVHTQHSALKDDPHTPDHVKKQLAHLKDKNKYVHAMRRASTQTVHHKDPDLHKITNTDAANKQGISKNPEIEKEKHDRVSKQFQNSKQLGHSMTKPIILHDKHTGHKHLLAGNTRLSHGVQDHKARVPVHAITYDSSKQK